MKRIFPLLALLAGLWLLPNPALALTCNALIDNFDFGNVGPGGSDTTSTLRWQCNRGNIRVEQTLNIRMCLFIGKGAAALDVNPRWMRRNNPPNTLISYDIFADSSLTQILNPENTGNPPLSFTLQFPANSYYVEGSIPIYGRLYPQTGTVLPYQYVDENLRVQPVYSSYNLSAPAPSVDECLHGGGDGSGTSSTIDLINVQAFIAEACTVGIATDLDFGEVSSLAGNHEQTSTIHLRCPSGTTWRLGLNDGMHASGVQRRMANSNNSAHVPYELYRDETRQARWGNTVGTDTNDGTGTGSVQDITVHGRTLQQPSTPPSGLYSDTITVTLTF